MDISDLSLTVFTCAGREHLLIKTWNSWKPVVAQSGAVRRLLAIDGNYDLRVCEILEPDIVIQSTARQGYIASIIRALALIDSEFFLWIEDDWIVNDSIHLGEALEFLRRNPKCLQVRWSKRTPLSEKELKEELAPGIFNSTVGFSANPCICRTKLVRDGFTALIGADKGDCPGVDGFEDFLTAWCASNKLVCAVANPGNVPAVLHAGDLESTPREWHMTKSAVGAPTNYVLAMGTKPPFWRKLWMAIKLSALLCRLLLRQLWDDWAYEFAFRVIGTYKNGRGHSSKRQKPK